MTDNSNFPAMLKAYLPEIQRALPQHLNGDRMARIALTAFRRTPKLAALQPSQRVRRRHPGVTVGP